jgi:hypothetical protein
MRDEYVPLRRAVTPFHAALNLLAAVGSVVLFITAFAVPKRSAPNQAAQAAFV